MAHRIKGEAYLDTYPSVHRKGGVFEQMNDKPRLARRVKGEAHLDTYLSLQDKAGMCRKVNTKPPTGT